MPSGERIVDAADEGQLRWDRNLNWLWRIVGGIGGALLFFGSGIGLKRLAPDYRDRASKWEAFQR